MCPADQVRLILDQNPDVNAVDTQGSYTPLGQAVAAGNEEGAVFLLEHGARTDVKCGGSTLEVIANSRGHRVLWMNRIRSWEEQQVAVAVEGS